MLSTRCSGGTSARPTAMCYLSDVSNSQAAKEIKFAKSRWFTRGWTLQELIAPTVVEFFASDDSLLGNRKELEVIIHKATGIPVKVLRGHSVFDFSIEERFSWVSHRDTTRPEDKAYCMLGIFNVSMPVIYGEGRERAIAHLREQIERPKRYKSFSSFVS
jgi:hypothetical protein